MRKILFVPKPITIIKTNNIDTYEYTRDGQGIRYCDLNIISKNTENDHINTKSSNNMAINMIPIKHQNELHRYFKQLNIKPQIIPENNDNNINNNNNIDNNNNNETNDNDESEDDEYIPSETESNNTNNANSEQSNNSEENNNTDTNE